MRLVDAELMKYNITHDFDDDGNAIPSSDEELTQKCLSINDVVGWLKLTPTVDAEPVRHAHWVYYKNMGYFCSACIESGLSPTNGDDNCGYSLDGTMNYCWNCGAKMDEERSEEWKL